MQCPKSIHCFLGDGHDGVCRDAGMTADGRSLDTMFLRLVMRDGEEIVVGRCPQCGSWAELDDDQLHGRVSTEHATDEGGCGFHETIDWLERYAA